RAEHARGDRGEAADALAGPGLLEDRVAVRVEPGQRVVDAGRGLLVGVEAVVRHGGRRGHRQQHERGHHGRDHTDLHTTLLADVGGAIVWMRLEASRVYRLLAPIARSAWSKRFRLSAAAQ